jgi:TM2 domain-containing membrane protein YozV
MAHTRSKTVATWLALLAGTFGAHRLYLYGTGDRWAWLHPWPTLLGLWGIRRVQLLGQDDHLSWLLLPLLGLMIAQACAFAIFYGLMADERWAARFNPGRPPQPTRWAPVLGVIAALMVGATALMATIAFGGQRYFEWQVEQAREISR